MAGKSWKTDEIKLAIALYCKLPFGQLHSRNPQVIALAQLLERSPGSVAMKLCNLASLDPAILESGRKGLDGASALDREVWAQFTADWHGLATEAELLLRQRHQECGIACAEEDEADVPASEQVDYSAETRQVMQLQRIKQSFFRKAVLVSYGGRCCMSGVSEPRLLIASHIVPWRADKANRLNPANGLCLSAIHDRAFDQGLLTLDDGYQVVLSLQLASSGDAWVQRVLQPLAGQSIRLPERFLPDPAFLAWHRQHVFLSAC